MKARVRLQQFGGMIPRVSERLLPETNAKIARNVKLKSGEIRGINALKPLKDFSDTSIIKAYRLPDPDAPTAPVWVGFASRDVTLIRGPLLNDAFERFYLFGDGRPKYNTLQRLKDGDPWLYLGVPQPTMLPTVSVVGGSGSDVDRSYVYTFVSAYGEEGPPSTPGDQTGKTDGSWNLSAMDTTVPDASNRNITTKRIYRTVAGKTVAEFFFVAEIPLTQATYSDTSDDLEISRNNILESEQWFEPPEGIKDAIVMPNGFFIGWNGRDVHFSESYRPHAWPPGYDQSTEFDIIGAGVFGQSAGIATTANTYLVTGVNPEGTTLLRSNTVEPATNRHSIVSMPYGVLYASDNGLMQISSREPTLVTRELVTKNEWLNTYSPNVMWAAKNETQYLAFCSDCLGITIDPVEPLATFTEVDAIDNVDYVQTDEFTGDVFVLVNGIVYEWDNVDFPRLNYQWRSKEYIFPKPVNLGAARVDLEGRQTVFEQTEDQVTAARSFNEARMNAAPLASIGFAAIGSTTQVTLPAPHDETPQHKQPAAGSPLLSTADLATEEFNVRFNVYVDNVLKYSELVGETVLTTGSESTRDKIMVKLPSGFKHQQWSFEVIGKRHVYHIYVAETAKGLADV